MLVKKALLEEILKKRGSSQTEADQKPDFLSVREQKEVIIKEKLQEEIAQLEQKKENLTKELEETLKTLEKSNLEEKEILQNAEAEAKEILSSSKEFLEEISENFDRLFRELVDLRKDFLSQVEPIVLELAIALSQKIIYQQVKLEPAVLKNLMLEALKEINLDPEEKSKLYFTVNPQNEEFARSYLEEFEQKYQNQIQLFLNIDPEIEEGSCILESPFGTVDLNFSSQINLFKLKLAQT